MTDLTTVDNRPVQGGAATPVYIMNGDIIVPLDLISNVQGAILYRSATGWVARLPGTDGQVLTTHGPAADPTWETPSVAPAKASEKVSISAADAVVNSASPMLVPGMTFSVTVAAGSKLLINASGSVIGSSANATCGLQILVDGVNALPNDFYFSVDTPAYLDVLFSAHALTPALTAGAHTIELFAFAQAGNLFFAPNPGRVCTMSAVEI